jgi:hypothetical protein
MLRVGGGGVIGSGTGGPGGPGGNIRLDGSPGSVRLRRPHYLAVYKSGPRIHEPSDRESGGEEGDAYGTD